MAVAENTDTMFNDILGTSLGVVKENQYSNIDKTSFGVDSTDKSSFFTGKPYVEDLGYTFLFRNYRADLGKWLSQDLIGYPDGWNNFAYCGNQILQAIDYMGTILVYPDSIKSSIDILKKTSTGNSIISQLEKSSHTHTINESSSGKGCSVSAINKANMSNPESGGTGSTINMDNFNPNNTSPDGSGWNRPYELGLLHELSHAADMDKGRLPQGQTGGVDNSEIDACKKTNDTLKELQKLYPDIYEIYDLRKDYGGVPFPKKVYE